MSKKQATAKEGRTLSTPRLIAGKILIGETVTIEAYLPAMAPRAQRWRGLVYDIRDDFAYIVVLGQQQVLGFPLEPLGAAPPRAVEAATPTVASQQGEEER